MHCAAAPLSEAERSLPLRRDPPSPAQRRAPSPGRPRRNEPRATAHAPAKGRNWKSVARHDPKSHGPGRRQSLPYLESLMMFTLCSHHESRSTPQSRNDGQESLPPAQRKKDAGYGSWWARQDSNPQPSRYERPALTIELQAPPRPADRQHQAAWQACARAGTAARNSSRLALRTPRRARWPSTASHQR